MNRLQHAVTDPTLNYRGRPLVRHTVQPGGADHIHLGDDQTVYTCGVKEAAMRQVLDPNLAQVAQAAPVAGGKSNIAAALVQVYARRPSKDRRPIGGDDHLITLQDRSEPLPSESLQVAQQRSALDPQAQEAAARLESAGRRVDRSRGVRVTVPGGRRTLDAIEWPQPEGISPGPSRRAGGQRSPVHGQPKVVPVQRAAPFIPVDHLGELLDHVTPAQNLQPHEERFRRLYVSGPGAAGVAPGDDSNVPRGARTVMGNMLAGVGDAPKERPSTARTARANASSLGSLLSRDFATGGPVGAPTATDTAAPHVRSPVHVQTTAPVIGSAAAAAAFNGGNARRAMPHTQSNIVLG